MEHRKKGTGHILISLRVFSREMFLLIKSPVFMMLTLLGNSLISLFSLAFYVAESPENPKLHNFMDALWWGFSTATTTGYGDIIPVTVHGKILGIILMLTGLALFAMFTALFAETILVNTRQDKL